MAGPSDRGTGVCIPEGPRNRRTCVFEVAASVFRLKAMAISCPMPKGNNICGFPETSTSGCK